MLKWTLFDQSPPISEIEWVYIDVDGYKIVNIYKPPPTRLQVSELSALQHPCLYTCDFNCQHMNGDSDNNSMDCECLANWANANNFIMCYNLKDAASLDFGWWLTSANQTLLFLMWTDLT